MLAVPLRHAAAQTAQDLIEVARSVVTADRQAVVVATMELTDTEGKAFWPLYHEYRSEMGKITDELMNLVLEYAKLYPNVPEEQAKQMLKTYTSLQQKQVDRRTAYLKKFSRVLPAAKALRFAQVETRLDLLVQLNLAATVPLTPVAGANLTQVGLPAEALATEAERAIKAFERADSGLKDFFNGSAGFAVFPSVGRGGLVFGGERGKGLLYESGKPVGEATLTELNVGAQAGVESFYEVIFFESEGALAHFKQSNFEMSAEVNAVAASEGAAKNAKYRDGVTVFTLARTGLMVQATIGGQKFKCKPLN